MKRPKLTDPSVCFSFLGSPRGHPEARRAEGSQKILRRSASQDEWSGSFPTTQLTPFEWRVLAATATIPLGETRSYKWVAKKIGSPKATRAVGQALHKNPFPLIIPCHRVVRSDGSLGGFAGGIEKKRRLLEIEKQIIGFF